MKLIVKKRKVPLAIRKLRALAYRLPPNHPKVPLIMNDLKKREAGYKGECSIDFPLSFLEPKSYFIFHDLRLQDQSRFFQLDTLLISKKFALIIEVKNMAGSLYFDPHFNQAHSNDRRQRNGLSRSHHASQPPGITIDQLVLEKRFSLTAHPIIDCHQ